MPFDWALGRLGLLETLTPSGEELKGTCPLPAHTGEKKKGTFFVNVGKGMFICHQCKKRGNVLDFVMAERGVVVKEAGEWLSQFFAREDEKEPEGVAESAPEVREDHLSLFLFEVCVKVLERARDPEFDVEACARRFSEWMANMIEGD